MAEAIAQGDIWWVLDDEPFRSEPGFHRPYLVVQGEALNRSGIKTVIACPVTGNLRFAAISGNVLLKSGSGGLPRDSVVNVSGISARDRARFDHWMGRLSPREIRLVLRGISEILQPDAID